MQNATITTASANEVSKSIKSANASRRLETRSDWERIYAHMAALVAAKAQGEALPEKPRDGFAFGKTSDAPHCRPYAQSLLAGFVSSKATKALKDTPLADLEKRTEIAIAILLATKLGGSEATKAKKILADAEPKQAKSFALAVLTIMQPQPSAQPTVEKPAAKPKRTRKAKTAQPTVEK